MFVRHTHLPISSSRRTVLCVHGLGESSLSFLEAFQSSDLQDFNVVAPDLMGHGCSSKAPNGNYSFAAQIERLSKVVNKFNISEFFLVGHSMGGDIATHFAVEHTHSVRGLINIEGNLTPLDVVISKQAVNAAEQGYFEKWFREDFMTKTVLNDWGMKWVACQRYYASLWFCDPDAFLLGAREVCERNLAQPKNPETETGSKFLRVGASKVYCWGGNISAETRKLLEDNNETIAGWGYEDASHWPMIDMAKEFYRRLSHFCSDK